MSTPVFTSPVASGIPTDPAVTTLTSIQVEASLAELAGTGIQLKSKLLAASFTLVTNSFAFWCQTLEIANGVTLSLLDDSSLEIS